MCYIHYISACCSFVLLTCVTGFAMQNIVHVLVVVYLCGDIFIMLSLKIVNCCSSVFLSCILCCCEYYCGLTKCCVLQCVFYDKLIMLKWLLMILVKAIKNTQKTEII
jgi:hypothetical protein